MQASSRNRPAPGNWNRNTECKLEANSKAEFHAAQTRIKRAELAATSEMRCTVTRVKEECKTRLAEAKAKAKEMTASKKLEAQCVLTQSAVTTEDPLADIPEETWKQARARAAFMAKVLLG